MEKAPTYKQLLRSIVIEDFATNGPTEEQEEDFGGRNPGWQDSPSYIGY